MSPTTFKSTGVRHFGAKFAKRGVDRFKTNFKMMWDRRWLSYAKKNRVDIFCRLSVLSKSTKLNWFRPLSIQIYV